jgi:hypothetical protein
MLRGYAIEVFNTFLQSAGFSAFAVAALDRASANKHTQVKSSLWNSKLRLCCS